MLQNKSNPLLRWLILLWCTPSSGNVGFRSSSQADAQATYKGVSRAIGTGWSDRYPCNRSKVIYVRLSIRLFLKPYSKQEQGAGHAALKTSDLLRVTLRSQLVRQSQDRGPRHRLVANNRTVRDSATKPQQQTQSETSSMLFSADSGGLTPTHPIHSPIRSMW